MKILLISNMYPTRDDPYFGAFIQNIENGLISSDVKIDKIVIAGQGKSIFQKIQKYYQFYKTILTTNFANYDYIHLSYPSHTFLPILLKKTSAKLIVRFHGLELVSDAKRDYLLKIRRFISRMAITKADIVVVPSSYFKGVVEELRTPARTYVYPSGGVNRDRFRRLTDYVNKDFSKNEINIGYVGRLDIGKGLETLLNAIAGFNYRYQLHIVGKGPLEEKIKHLADKLKLNVKFYGAVPNSKLPEIYNEMDVFVFPTERKGESFGNVGIESMACGVPVIGSNFGGLLEYIIHGTNGYTFEKGSPQDLLYCINKFYKLTLPERSEMVSEALVMAKRFDRDVLSAAFVAYLEANL